MIHYDDVLKDYVGEFGTYQKRCYMLLGIAAPLPVAFIALSPVFLFATTDAWCRVPEADAISEQFCMSNVTNNCEELVKNLTIPWVEKDVGCGSTWQFDQCHRFNISYDAIMSYSPRADVRAYVDNASTIACDHGWEYDRSQYKSTVSQQFNLVCDRFYLNAMGSSVYMLGMFVGSIVMGNVIDKIGRMKGFIISYIICIASGVIEAFSPNYIVFAVVRFFLALGQYGVFLAGFVLACEFVGPTKRTITGMVWSVFFAVGYMIFAVYGYLIREWWVLQLVIMVPCVVFLSYYWIIPESPRWLISVGRTEDAEKIIRHCAKVNKVDIPKDLFNQELLVEEDGAKKETSEIKKHGALDLLRYPNMRKKSLILYYTWVTIVLVYYGISFDTSNLGGNAYLNMFIAGAIEIPAYILSIILMEVPIIGRRGSLMSTMIFGGVACIGLAFFPACSDYVWLGITLAMLGKFGITAAFAMIYVYSAELFPTPLRSIGVGLCSMCSRVGGILAPQLLLMGELWAPLPPVVFGITSIIAGVLMIFLPETRGVKLPETFEEAENFGIKQNTPRENTSNKEERDCDDINVTV